MITYIHNGKVKHMPLSELKQMKIELTKSWEDLCTNCGKCCFQKSFKKGVWLIDYDKPCEFLKFIGRKSRCEVYSDRFTKCVGCHSIPEAIQKSFLPSSCAYVKMAKAQYKSPIDDGAWYKKARKSLTKYDSPYAGTPTGGTMNLPAEPPYKATGGLTREDLAKPKNWKLRRKQLRERMRQQKLASEGKIGCSDPRQKTTYNIKPSGHALGG